jgi:hypothetical protein
MREFQKSFCEDRERVPGAIVSPPTQNNMATLNSPSSRNAMSHSSNIYSFNSVQSAVYIPDGVREFLLQNSSVFQQFLFGN